MTGFPTPPPENGGLWEGPAWVEFSPDDEEPRWEEVNPTPSRQNYLEVKYAHFFGEKIRLRSLYRFGLTEEKDFVEPLPPLYSDDEIEAMIADGRYGGE
jgi:hypothetical protein